MTGAAPRPVSAYLVESGDDEAGVERANATRSEAVALAERFWTATQGYAGGGIADGVELTLSFTRDEEEDFIELSAFGPDGISARHRFVDAWKLFRLIPMRHRRDLELDLHDREEIVAFVEAYVTMPVPGAFRDWMQARGATLARYR